MRIFIAEDDPAILAGFTMMVRSMGHEVIGQAVDGENALVLIEKLQPDLILMDINLPKIDGITVIERCNKKRVIPSIIITGYRDREQIDRASVSGVYGYLHKPIDEYELRAAIEIVRRRSEDYRDLEKDLQTARWKLEERKIIERAKGIVVKQLDVSEDEALNYMQKRSRNKNVKLVNVAREIVDAYEKFRKSFAE